MQGRIGPRLGALSGVLFVALILGPSSTGSDAEIVIVLELIAILLFLPFLGYLYGVLVTYPSCGGLSHNLWGFCDRFRVAGIAPFDQVQVVLRPSKARRFLLSLSRSFLRVSCKRTRSTSSSSERFTTRASSHMSRR